MRAFVIAAALLAPLAASAACDINKPTFAQMRVGHVGADLWAYWFCPNEYTRPAFRARYILAGAIVDGDEYDALAWAKGTKPDWITSTLARPTEDAASMPAKYGHLMSAVRAATLTDAEYIASHPIWLVAKNGTATTRPMVLADGTATTKRATVGAACDCSTVHIKTTSGTRCPLGQLPGVPLEPEVTYCAKQP